MAAVTITLQATNLRRIGVTGSGTEFTQANSGTAIDIPISGIAYNRGLGISNDSYAGGTQAPQTNVSAIGAPAWIIKGTLDLKQSSDRAIMSYLDTLSSNKGLIKFYTSDDTNNTTMLRYMREAGNITPSNFLYVPVDKVTINQSADSPFLAKYTLNLLEHTE